MGNGSGGKFLFSNRYKGVLRASFYVNNNERESSVSKGGALDGPIHSPEQLLMDASFLEWVSGRASLEVQNRWNAWLNASPIHREMYQEALELLQAGRFGDSRCPDVEQEWRRLQARLDRVEESRDARAGRRGRSRSSLRLRNRHPWPVYGLAVFMVLAALALVRVYLLDRQPSMEWTVVETRLGEKKKIHLPDGTVIHLNARSTLHYPKQWTQDTPRWVRLRGEAFFQVRADSRGYQRQFRVQTADGIITVHGTRFDVWAYPEGTRVVLEEGRVEVRTTRSPGVRAFLRPGEKVFFQGNSRRLVVERTNLQTYLTWWKPELKFDHTPFAEIVDRLERTYGVKIVVEDDRLLSRTLSGSIENTGLPTIIQALSRVLQAPVDYRDTHIVFRKGPNRF